VIEESRHQDFFEGLGRIRKVAFSVEFDVPVIDGRVEVVGFRFDEIEKVEIAVDFPVVRPDDVSFFIKLRPCPKIVVASGLGVVDPL
jgi:hypothetical protein